MAQGPCIRDSPDQACRPCSRRGFSHEQCGRSTFGPEAERKLTRQRGEHTLDAQNDVRTNASAHGTGSTAQQISPALPLDFTANLGSPFGFTVQTTQHYNPETWHNTIAFESIASDANFEEILQAFVLENCFLASPDARTAACDAFRRARDEHTQGTILLGNHEIN